MQPPGVRQKTQYYGFTIMVCQWKRVFIWGGIKNYHTTEAYYYGIHLKQRNTTKPITTVTSRLRISCAILQYQKIMISIIFQVRKYTKHNFIISQPCICTHAHAHTHTHRNSWCAKHISFPFISEGIHIFGSYNCGIKL